MSETGAIEWIAVDWGTTNMRAWAMRGEVAVDSVLAATGMGNLARDAFEPALLSAISGWLPGDGTVPVLACGMVGARQGWREAPYVAVPSPPLVADATISIAGTDPRIAVTIVHGLRQAEPADVMRGEETQIAGLIEVEPDFDGVVCLPGTHTKWVRIRDGQVEGFSTFMTGELFALVLGQSVLRHAASEAEGDDPAAFNAAVLNIGRQPAALAARLFSIRAASLTAGLGPDAARARLSGLLIGLEIAGVLDDTGDRPVTIIGTDALSTLYERAISARGGTARRLDGSALTLRGLVAARRIVSGKDIQ